MTTLIQETYTQAASKTCSNCPYFQDFGEPNGRGWCRAFDQMARQHHERTGACDTEIEALEKESQQQLAAHAPEPQLESFGSLDAASNQLQSTQSAETEFEQGYNQGQQDAAAGLHPMYRTPSDECSSGYLLGYDSILNAETQQPKISAPAQTWSVIYDPKWQWYQAWVDSKCIGHGTTHQEAERIAQRYIAVDEIIHRQNAMVMKPEAGGRIVAATANFLMQPEVAQKYALEFEQLSSGGKLEIIRELLGHRQQALDEAALKPGKLHLNAPAYSSVDEQGLQRL